MALNSDPNTLKILFFGAGVLGSLYAARMCEAGNNVAVVARGTRFDDISREGIILEKFDTGERSVTKVRVLDHMPVEESFDLCVVLVRKNQLESALSVLRKNRKIPSFLFLVNTAEGPDKMIEALGKERVLMGHVNAGGERDGKIVRYMVSGSMTVGELDGGRTERLEKIIAAFSGAEFKVHVSRNIDAWKRCHVALVGPLANAMYMAGSCNYRLSRSKSGVRMGINGIREALKVIQKSGSPIEPSSFRYIFSLPDFILVPMIRRLLGMKLMDIGGARHVRAARDEMTQLNEEILAAAEKIGIQVPVLKELHRFSDPSVQPVITD